MIVTCKKQIPARWILFAILPWASFVYNYSVVSVAFLFSLKKFVENPAGLTFILSLPGFISVVSAPLASFLSDRIWTRFGRRKPFLVVSWSGIVMSMVLMPIAPNFWTLVALYMLYNLFVDLNSTLEPLKQEIIPPHERGRAVGGMEWLANLANIAFYFLALGRFDDFRFMAGVPLFGEAAIYWSSALLVCVMLMLIMLGIKEVDQKSPLRGERLSVRNLFLGLMDAELWPVYLLVFSSAAIWSGLGPLSNLLYTDQWGYSMQEMGVNIAVGGVINMFVIGLLTVFADRLNRMRAYQILISISLLDQVAYYCYVTFLLPDRRPSLIEIIVFGESLTILGLLTSMIYIPLIYDYVRRNKMGTFVAGSGMVGRIIYLLALNGAGLFVSGYSALFQPPAGEMTRVVLRQPISRAEILKELRVASWRYPGDGSPAPSGDIDANVWQANGAFSKVGRCWEIRLRDKDSEKLAARKEELAQEKSRLASPAGDGISSRIDAIDAQLNARAEKFRAATDSVLGNAVMADGEQLLAASVRPALIVAIPAATSFDPRALEKLLAALRDEYPGVIDLRPLGPGRQGVALSAILASDIDPATFVRALRDSTRRIAAKQLPGVFLSHSQMPAVSRVQALTLDLAVGEEPVDTYVSPVTRIVNRAVALFGDPPGRERRLAAAARNLRMPPEIDHVHVGPGAGSRTISTTAVLSGTTDAPAGEVDDAVESRLRVLLGRTASPLVLTQARTLYDRIEKAAASQRITVVRPSLGSAYTPMKYDYMSGYLWVFLCSLLGIGSTILFCRLEASGFVHKRGLEESDNS
jgi:Na+/melibiose symporter-like transporter